MNKIFALCLIVLIIIPSTINAENVEEYNPIFQELLDVSSSRKQIEDVIIVPDTNPFFGLIGSYIACWYDEETNMSGLIPLLIHHNQKLTYTQENFLKNYLDTNEDLLVLGETLDCNYETTEILGSPPTVAINAALHVFSQASSLVILPYDEENAYEISLIACPLASYLNIPVLIYDNNQMELEQVCDILNVTSAYIVGDIELSLPNITTIFLETKEDIQNAVINIIKIRFESINYITLTNPSLAPAALALPEAENGNLPTFISYPASLA